MLTTLLRPSSGNAVVDGWDVVKDSAKVRKVINYVPQLLTADDTITGYENLLFYAKLYGLSRTSRERAIVDALNFVGLQERASELVSGYSGGMKRRLELATVLVNRPKILFLDEPTIGLDPRSRLMIWDCLEKMRHEHETTIFVTTNYMDEADRLCDRIAIMDLGEIAVEGRPSELKRSVGADSITLTTDAEENSVVELIGKQAYVKSIEYRDGVAKLLLQGKSGDDAAPMIISELNNHGWQVSSVAIQRSSLDDVFKTYTGRSLEQEAPMNGPIRAVNRARLLKGMVT